VACVRQRVGMTGKFQDMKKPSTAHFTASYSEWKYNSSKQALDMTLEANTTKLVPFLVILSETIWLAWEIGCLNDLSR
jgi:hypothetical protein